MELKSLNCPNCGAVVQIPDGVDRFFCTYCGSQIQIDDGKITIDLNANIKLDQHYTDVARVKELELQEQERKRQEDQQRIETKRKIYCILTLLISIAVYFFGIYCAGSNQNLIGKIGAVFSATAVLIGPIASFIIAPKQWRSKTNITRPKGCISILVDLFAIFAIMFIIAFGYLAISLPIIMAWG